MTSRDKDTITFRCLICEGVFFRPIVYHVPCDECTEYLHADFCDKCSSLDGPVMKWVKREMNKPMFRLRTEK